MTGERTHPYRPVGVQEAHGSVAELAQSCTSYGEPHAPLWRSGMQESPTCRVAALPGQGGSKG